jgi:hypothetical protein
MRAVTRPSELKKLSCGLSGETHNLVKFESKTHVLFDAGSGNAFLSSNRGQSEGKIGNGRLRERNPAAPSSEAHRMGRSRKPLPKNSFPSSPGFVRG